MPRMPGTETRLPEGQRGGGAILPALCLLAALRVAFMSAAFPFFNNVDEEAHFDLVCKYSHGHVPRGLEPYGEEAARLIVRFATLEYGRSPEEFPGGSVPPPPWLGFERPTAEVEAARASWQSQGNHEATQPPAYYAVAGLWYRLGKGIGLQGGRLLYWIRILNVPIYAAVVWIAGRIAARAWPRSPTVKYGAPFLLAFLPQDVFYTINSDVLSPLMTGLALLGLLAIRRDGGRSLPLCGVTGLAAAAACLTKVTNAAVLPLVAYVGMTGLLRAGSPEERRRRLPGAALLAGAAAGPVLAWVVRNAVAIGDPTGSAAKIASLGWATKPLGAILDHPLLTPAGLWLFWRELMALFWRGELVWHMQPLGIGWVDLVYAVTSLVLLAAAIAGLMWDRRRRAEPPDPGRPAEATGLPGATEPFCLALVAGAIASLMVLSLLFDFGDSWYPSRDHPYFVSGRLIAGALIPFAILYARGLERILPPGARRRGGLAVLVALGMVSVASEAWLARGPVASLYNWFHM
jgi:hypothetical protein